MDRFKKISYSEVIKSELPIIYTIGKSCLSYNFYYLCSLLEDILNRKQLNFREIVFFTRKKSYSFPTSEISKLDVNFVENRIIIETTFLNLYGVNHALPSHFSDYIVYEQDNFESLREFLDIFHNILSHLYYEMWQKYKVYIFNTIGNKCIDNLFKDILAVKNDFDVFAKDVLNLRCFFLNRTISKDSINGILLYYFPDSQIEIFDNCIDVYVNDDELKLDGKKNISHENPVVLGNCVYSSNYAFKVIIHVSNLELLSDFKSFCDLKRKVKYVMTRLLGSIYKCSIYVKLINVSESNCILNNNSNILLGKNSYLGDSNHTGIFRLCNIN